MIEHRELRLSHALRQDAFEHRGRELVDDPDFVEQLEGWDGLVHATRWDWSGRRGAGDTGGAWPMRASIWMR